MDALILLAPLFLPGAQGGCLGAGSGTGSCAAAPFRTPTEELDHLDGCPGWAECCTEYGFCHPKASWDAALFRDCNGESNGAALPPETLAAEAVCSGEAGEEDYTQEDYTQEDDSQTSTSSQSTSAQVYSSSSSLSASRSSSSRLPSDLEQYLSPGSLRQGRISSLQAQRSSPNRLQPTRFFKPKPSKIQKSKFRSSPSRRPPSRFNALGSKHKGGLNDQAVELLRIRDGQSGGPRRGGKSFSDSKSPTRSNQLLTKPRDSMPPHTWSSWGEARSTTALPQRVRLQLSEAPVEQGINNSCTWDTVRGVCQSTNTSFPRGRLQVPHSAPTGPNSPTFPSFPSTSVRNQKVSQVFLRRDERLNSQREQSSKNTNKKERRKNQGPNNRPNSNNSGIKDRQRLNRIATENNKVFNQTTQSSRLAKVASTTDRKMNNSKRKGKSSKMDNQRNSRLRGRKGKAGPKCSWSTPEGCGLSRRGKTERVSPAPRVKERVKEKQKFRQLFPKRDKLPKLVLERNEEEKRRLVALAKEAQLKKEDEQLAAKKIREKIQENLIEREERRKKKLLNAQKQQKSEKLEKKKKKKKERRGKVFVVGEALWTVEEWLRRG